MAEQFDSAPEITHHYSREAMDKHFIEHMEYLYKDELDFSDVDFDDYDFNENEVEGNASNLYVLIRGSIDTDTYWYVHEIEADIADPYIIPEDATHKQEFTASGWWIRTRFYDKDGGTITYHDDLLMAECVDEDERDEVEEI